MLSVAHNNEEISAESEQQKLDNYLQENIVTPLCTHLENYLRLTVFDRAGKGRFYFIRKVNEYKA